MHDAQAEAQFQQGLALQHAGRAEEAAAEYRQALALRRLPCRPVPAGPGVAATGPPCRSAGAVRALRRAGAEEPQVYLQRAELHFLRQDYAAALADFDRALALAAASGRAIPVPDQGAIALNRGTALEHLAREDEALAAYEQAALLAPENARAWESRGRLLLKRMRREDAEASFARALALNPALAGAQAGRGHALIHLRRNREAIAQFRGLEARDPAVAAVGLLSAAQLICDWDTIEAVGPKVAQMAARR